MSPFKTIEATQRKFKVKLNSELKKHVSVKEDIDALAKLKVVRNSNNRPILPISN